jgi:hypothetical protein
VSLTADLHAVRQQHLTLCLPLRSGEHRANGMRVMSSPSTLPKPFVFVLIPFDQAFSDIYKFGIKGAADDVGAYAERVDEQIFSEGMLDRIFNQISKADVIVADMTGRNPNVFYEVGYAHALGKIVLLLTQNADDIPFDLKHRQHTVYGGKIEVLRRELAGRIEWAVGESRKLRTQHLAERFSLRVQGLEATAPGAGDPPSVRGKVTSRGFYVTLELRSQAPEVTQAITHIYLFASKKASLFPTEWRVSNAFDFTATTTWPSLSKPTQAPARLDSFAASPLDSADGLTVQYRLPITFPSLPPGAVELARLDFQFQDGANESDDLFRLRLNAASGYHDFAFKLQVTSTPEKAAGPVDK